MDKWGIRLFGGSTENWLQANVIEDCNRGAVGVFYDSDLNSIINNALNQSPYGLLIDQAQNNQIRDNIIAANDIDSQDNSENQWDQNYWAGYDRTEPYLIDDSSYDLNPRMIAPEMLPAVAPPLAPLPPALPDNYIFISSDTTWETTGNISARQIIIEDGATLTIQNSDLDVHAAFVVRSGGALSIQNSILRADPHASLEWMDVDNAGSLTIQNSYLSGSGHGINALAGSVILVENTELHFMGEWSKALHLETGNAVIRNNHFYGGYGAIQMQSDGVELTGNIIEKNGDGITYFLGNDDDSGTIIEGNNLIDLIEAGFIAVGMNYGHIAHNVFQDIHGHALILSPASPTVNTDHTTINGNMFIRCGSVIDDGSDNIWYDAGSSCGNYYSDYPSLYPDAQESTLHPAIWDTPYDIASSFGFPASQDIYPMMISSVLYAADTEVLGADRVDITFSRNIEPTLLSPIDLNSVIEFASDGITYSPLTEFDAVDISQNRLSIYFASPLTGSTHRLRIDGGIITDGVMTMDQPITSGTFSGMKVSRISGVNRYQTSVEVSQSGWPLGAETVVLARGDNFADALAGVPLAHYLNAPILLTSSSQIGASVLDEIRRLDAETVFILGGTAAISSAVETALINEGLSVERISGDNRYDTAAQIARMMKLQGAAATDAVIAVGSNFPDALSAASYAAIHQQPILLVTTLSVPDCTETALKDMGVQGTIIVGGTAVISDAVLTELSEYTTPERVAGSNRYSTAIALANRYSLDSSLYYIATGLNFPDAITGAVLAAKRNCGVLLVQGTLAEPNQVVQDFCLNDSVDGVSLFGGTSVISSGIAEWFLQNL